MTEPPHTQKTTTIGYNKLDSHAIHSDLSFYLAIAIKYCPRPIHNNEDYIKKSLQWSIIMTTTNSKLCSTSKNTVSNQFTLRTKITAKLKLIKPTKIKTIKST